MNKSSLFVKKRFADEMKRCCAERYSKIPSNAKLAKDFYYSTNYSLNVNRETVRKWLKGEAFPDLDYLIHLINWLELDMSNVFEYEIPIKLNENLNLPYLDISAFENLTFDNLESMISLINILKTKIKTSNLIK
jgi:transcriptional regulator with XRE-family HTH domain